jgi:hypothetical protein
MTSLVHRVPLLRKSIAIGAVVLLLHFALVGWLLRAPAWSDRETSAPDQQPLQVRLWWASPSPQPAAPAQRVQRPQLSVPDQQENPRPMKPQAGTGPAAAPPSAMTDAPAATTAVPGMPSEPTIAAPLNLTLPRSASAPWRQRNPALDDPRANSTRMTMEQKLANAMGGDGSWVMERVDLNTIRYRRGNDCVQLTRSRAGQLELGGNAFRESWLAGNC